MKKLAFFLLMLMWLSPVHGEVGDGLDYFTLGLQSSTTNKKIEYFTKALELNPNLAAAYEKRGLLYFFKEEYDKVIQDFRTYINLAPAKAEAFRMLGMGYLKSGLYQSAINSFNRALQMEPDLPTAYAGRAEAYLLTGNYDQAIEDSTKAIQLGGDEPFPSDDLVEEDQREGQQQTARKEKGECLFHH